MGMGIGGRATRTSAWRWQGMPIAAWAIRALVALAPPAAAVAATLTAAAVLTATGVRSDLPWWGVLVGSALGAGWMVDRAVRRLLPVAALLRLSIAFPDRAPSRFRVALRATTLAGLRRRLERGDLDHSPDQRDAVASLLALAAAMNAHDRRTRGHSERVRAIADLMGRELGLSEAERDRLRWAALLHDVGKLSVPTEVLNKTGELSAHEWDVVRRHPLEGMRIAHPLLRWLGPWALTIQQHHEKWDGSGYPLGLSGTQIGLGARIVAVADAYDAMTGVRAYGRVLTPDEARVELARHAGSQFDPRAVRALLTISVGDLNRVFGLWAWLAPVPFVGGLRRLERSMVVAASTVVIAAGLGAALSADLGRLPSAETEAAAVVADAPAPVRVAGVQVTSGPQGPVAVTPPAPSHPSGNLPGAAAPEVGTSGERTPAPAPAPAPATAGPSTVAAPAGEPPAPAPTTTTTTTPVPATTTTTTPTTTTPTTPPTTSPPALLGPAVDDAVSAPSQGATVIDVLANDGGSDSPTVAIVSDPLHGEVDVLGNGSIRYKPARGFVGDDQFEYSVCDPAGSCDTALVSVRVG
jgi:putative nucleotidyltransferase with HDIG domain